MMKIKNCIWRNTNFDTDAENCEENTTEVLHS